MDKCLDTNLEKAPRPIEKVKGLKYILKRAKIKDKKCHTDAGPAMQAPHSKGHMPLCNKPTIKHVRSIYTTVSLMV